MSTFNINAYQVIIFDWDGTLAPSMCYANDFDSAPQLFADTKAVLEALSDRGIEMAIATAMPKQALAELLDEHGIGAYFVVTCTAEQSQSKPHPQMCLDILEQLPCQANQCLMVGDSPTDIQMAHNAGIDAVAVLTGLGDMNDLAQQQPLAVLNCLSDLLK